MTIIIPAYNPDKHLLDLIKQLKEYNYPIIVVNDGSTKKDIFDKIKNDVTLLIHEVNQGKGAAMKTAIKYVNNNLDEDGYIFVDADGQHKVNDIIKLIDIFYKLPTNLIIGVRVFDKNVPIRSRIGNIITRILFKLKTGKYLTDTQTGLRCISSKYSDILLEFYENRYEYEINMLKNIIKNNIDIFEVPIETIYFGKNNSNSHFKPIKDSYLIYKELFK